MNQVSDEFDKMFFRLPRPFDDLPMPLSIRTKEQFNYQLFTHQFISADSFLSNQKKYFFLLNQDGDRI